MRAIDAPGAWRYATGEGIVIGIADTGQTWHPELAAKTLPGYDFVSADQSRDGNGWDPNPNDEGDWGPRFLVLCGMEPTWLALLRPQPITGQE